MEKNNLISSQWSKVLNNEFNGNELIFDRCVRQTFNYCIEQKLNIAAPFETVIYYKGIKILAIM